MELTREQTNIIQSTGNIRINAVAGSGKTTTIIEYARTRPATSRILYLAFNRSVKLEAQKRFAEKGIRNVKVETAHSIAYRHVVLPNGYRVSAHGYKPSEIADLLQVKAGGEKHVEYILASHIGRCFAMYCNSDTYSVADINYIDTAPDAKVRSFISVYQNYIKKHAEILFEKMEKGEIEVTHDFYLKKFQMQHPQLHYDYILFDEGQDASPAMLDVFSRQLCNRVIVGDTHQQIYGWRFAVNSLEKVDFTSYPLASSFRCNPEVATLANKILALKKYAGTVIEFEMEGLGTCTSSGSHAIIARTNLGLLKKAIGYTQDRTRPQQIYFEGNINSYTYADEGASLYDVLNLYNGKFHLIRDKLVSSMRELYELEDYVDKTGDMQLGMMVEIVKQYGNEIPAILRKIKEIHVGDEEKHKAAVVFSTVHRCKGMEYDLVELVDDFITEEKLKKLKEEQKADRNQMAKTIEEINLLYVAVTRTKNKIRMPESLLPEGHPASDHIEVIPMMKELPAPQINDETFLEILRKQKETKAYNVEKIRTVHKGAYAPWTSDQDAELTVLFCEGKTIPDMAKHFGRTKGAILSRIKKLELYG